MATRTILSQTYHNALHQLHYHTERGDELSAKRWVDIAEQVAEQCLKVTGGPVIPLLAEAPLENNQD